MPGREAAIDLVNRWFAFANAHDVEGIVSLLAEDATWQDSGVPLVRKGKEANAKSLRYSFNAFPDWHFDYRIVLADEHTVAVEIDNTATWTGPCPPGWIASSCASSSTMSGAPVPAVRAMSRRASIGTPLSPAASAPLWI